MSVLKFLEKAYVKTMLKGRFQKTKRVPRNAVLENILIKLTVFGQRNGNP